MNRYLLERTGAQPIEFQGELLAEVDGNAIREKPKGRWHVVRIYRTANDKYVVEVVYKTIFRQEDEWHWARVVNGQAADVARALEEIGDEVLDTIVGYPEGEEYRKRQKRLEEDVFSRYCVTVSKALHNTDFAERIG